MQSTQFILKFMHFTGLTLHVYIDKSSINKALIVSTHKINSAFYRTSYKIFIAARYVIAVKVYFLIVILTPDDILTQRAIKINHRKMKNVTFDLFYFINLKNKFYSCTQLKLIDSSFSEN